MSRGTEDQSARLVGSVCLDGWASSGKTTLARSVGMALNLPAIHTGMLYRSTALLWLSGDRADWRELAEGASEPSTFRACVSWPSRPAIGPPGIWDDDVTLAVTRVAREFPVRDILNDSIRRFVVRFGPAVLEGRDTGIRTVPEARVRFFLNCDHSVRAARARPNGRLMERDWADKMITDLEAQLDSYVELDTAQISVLAATEMIVKAYATAFDLPGGDLHE